MNNEIFVFGSNLAGIHGAGAARYAVTHHSATYRQGIGLQGYSYAIPTKDWHIKTLPLKEIQTHVDNFIEFAKQHPELVFNVTRIGCGLAGYKDEEIAPMFEEASSNVNLPAKWKPYMKNPHSYIYWEFDKD